jgi:hypothetical protein
MVVVPHAGMVFFIDWLIIICVDGQQDKAFDLCEHCTIVASNDGHDYYF